MGEVSVPNFLDLTAKRHDVIVDNQTHIIC
jgi:hypothetical protein